MLKIIEESPDYLFIKNLDIKYKLKRILDGINEMDIQIDKYLAKHEVNQVLDFEDQKRLVKSNKILRNGIKSNQK